VGRGARACMHPSALKLYREKKDWFYRPSARVILLVDARTSWCPSSTCACPSPTTAPFPSRLPPPPSLNRTYLVGLAADAAGLSGLLRTDSSEWSARGDGLAYRGNTARAPAGRRWWSLEEGWAGARAGVGLGRRREGNRKDRHRPRLDKSKTRLESPWPCRMVSVGGGGGGV